MNVNHSFLFFLSILCQLILFCVNSFCFVSTHSALCQFSLFCVNSLSLIVGDNVSRHYQSLSLSPTMPHVIVDNQESEWETKSFPRLILSHCALFLFILSIWCQLILFCVNTLSLIVSDNDVTQWGERVGNNVIVSTLSLYLSSTRI